MKQRLISWMLLLSLGLSLFLCGCTPLTKFQTVYLDLFDTVTVVSGYAKSQAAFDKVAAQIHDELLEYHQDYDIYNEYPGRNNLATVNAHPGETVPVSDRILDLLRLGQAVYDQTGGAVNIAMGSVLYLWHQARESEPHVLPDEGALRDAAKHCDISDLRLEDGTVTLLDEKMRLDVGAIAKGYATEQVARGLEAQGLSGYLLSVGGNVRTVGRKPDGSGWVIGVEDPDEGGALLLTLNVEAGSVVTSGDYQRYFVVDGVRYCHIIDPQTLFPATRYSGVTIFGPDSGQADALSTALFLLPQEEGAALLPEGYGALWADPEENLTATPLFRSAVREAGLLP